MTGFVLALISFLASSGKFYSIGSKVFFGFVIVPSAIFALCGATIGVRTLDSERGRSGTILSMGWGAAVAAISFVLFILGWAIVELMAADRPDPWLFVGIGFYLMAFWGSIRLVPLLLIGILSGWLLHLLKLRFME